jgi:hypothetical protein
MCQFSTIDLSCSLHLESIFSNPCSFSAKLSHHTSFYLLLQSSAVLRLPQLLPSLLVLLLSLQLAANLPFAACIALLNNFASALSFVFASPSDSELEFEFTTTSFGACPGGFGLQTGSGCRTFGLISCFSSSSLTLSPRYQYFPRPLWRDLI